MLLEKLCTCVTIIVFAPEQTHNFNFMVMSAPTFVKYLSVRN